MKQYIAITIIMLLSLTRLSAQSYEAQQLILDVEKLAQLKRILSDMKTGYEIVSKGYSTIRDISQGNFSLHDAFLNGLWLVSPTVRKYWKIPEIIGFQIRLVQEYKTAFNNYKRSGYFTADEIDYLGKVYRNLFDQSLKSIDDLTTVLSAHSLRMNDDERLAAIDQIYTGMQDKLSFLHHFNNNNALLALQRQRAQQEASRVKWFYNVP